MNLLYFLSRVEGNLNNSKGLLEFETFTDYVEELFDEDHESWIKYKNLLGDSKYSKLKNNKILPTKHDIVTLALVKGLNIVETQKIMNIFGYHLTKYINYDKIIHKYLYDNVRTKSVVNLNLLLLDDNALEIGTNNENLSIKELGLDAYLYMNLTNRNYLYGNDNDLKETYKIKLDYLRDNNKIDNNLYNSQIQKYVNGNDKKKKGNR